VAFKERTIFVECGVFKANLSFVIPDPVKELLDKINYKKDLEGF